MRILTPADYGALSLVTSFIAIASAVCGLGLRQLFTLEYFHQTDDQRNQLIQRIIFVYTSINLPLLLYALANSRTIARVLFFDEVTPTVIVPMLVLTFLYFFA